MLQLLRAQRTGAVLICEGPKLVGIFTERDALKLMARGADFTTPVREVMSSPPATIASRATVGDAIRVMAEGGYRHLPIVTKRAITHGRFGGSRHRPLSGGPFSGNRVQPAPRSEDSHAGARRSLSKPLAAGEQRCLAAATKPTITIETHFQAARAARPTRRPS